MEPGGEPELPNSFAVPPHHILGGRHAGLDDSLGETLGEDVVRDAADRGVHSHLLGRTRLEPADREALAAHDPGSELRRQRRREGLVLRTSDPVRQREGRGPVDGDLLGVALGEELGEACPLVRLVLGAPSAFEEAADVVARYGEALDALARSAIVEEQDGASTRRDPGGGQHRPDDGILVVLTGNQHPGVDALASHQIRNHPVESLLEPGIDDARPLPHGENAGHVVGSRGGRLGGWRHAREHGHGSGSEQQPGSALTKHGDDSGDKSHGLLFVGRPCGAEKRPSLGWLGPRGQPLATPLREWSRRISFRAPRGAASGPEAVPRP